MVLKLSLRSPAHPPSQRNSSLLRLGRSRRAGANDWAGRGQAGARSSPAQRVSVGNTSPEKISPIAAQEVTEGILTTSRGRICLAARELAPPRKTVSHFNQPRFIREPG